MCPSPLSLPKCKIIPLLTWNRASLGSPNQITLLRPAHLLLSPLFPKYSVASDTYRFLHLWHVPSPRPPSLPWRFLFSAPANSLSLSHEKRSQVPRGDEDEKMEKIPLSLSLSLFLSIDVLSSKWWSGSETFDLIFRPNTSKVRHLCLCIAIRFLETEFLCPVVGEGGGSALAHPKRDWKWEEFFLSGERESVFSSSPSPCLGERRLADLFKSVCLVCIQSNAVMSRSFSLYPEWIMRCPLLDLPDGGSCGRPLGHKKAFNTRVCSTNSYIRKIKKFTKLNSWLLLKIVAQGIYWWNFWFPICHFLQTTIFFF